MMSGEYFEVSTAAGPILVEADNGWAAVGFARRGLKARRLTGAEVRALPADAVIHKATPADDAGADDPDPLPPAVAG